MMRGPPTRAPPRAAGAGTGEAGQGRGAARPRAGVLAARPPRHARQAHAPGKRSSSARWPAARSASTSLRLCVLFPARSTPSSTMSAPRRPAMLRRLRATTQPPLPAAAAGSHWPEWAARARMPGAVPASVGLAGTGAGAGRGLGSPAPSGGAPGPAGLAGCERGAAAGGVRPSGAGRPVPVGPRREARGCLHTGRATAKHGIVTVGPKARDCGIGELHFQR